MFEEITRGIRGIFDTPEAPIPLHVPWFDRDDEETVLACIRSTFVSSVGAEITAVEQELASFTGAPYAVAVVNGTAALHTALVLAGVGSGDLVITQALTFIATSNAITYVGARPVFLDIHPITLGLDPKAVQSWLELECRVEGDRCVHLSSGKVVKACLPMHTFGIPMDMIGLQEVCAVWHITVIEDAAEALGSYRNGRHAGTFASIGTLSFNGNKIITCGGGGALLFNDANTAARAKHLTTQAKVPHPWSYAHDAIGYNHRMPALNAALLLSQLRKLPHNLSAKRTLHERYRVLFAGTPYTLVTDPEGTSSNHWLNAVLLRDLAERDALLMACMDNGIQARPAWDLNCDQAMFKADLRGAIPISRSVQERLVNLPSSANP